MARWGRGLAIAGAVGVFLAAAGAFGTGGAPFLLRLGYWVGLMLLGTLVATGIYWLMTRLAWLDERPRAQLVIGTLAMSAIYTVIVWAISVALFGARGALPGIADYFVPVLLVSAAMTALSVLAARQPVETHAGPAGAPPPRFYDRLPPKLRGAELYAVEAQDHYLRLHTDRGSDLILMRLSDAVSELEGVEGAQTHRSWWVAKAAVASARRADGRAVLVLKSGAEAPVSRSYAAALRQEGWF